MHLEKRGKQSRVEGREIGRERKNRRIQETDERKETECQEWLGQLPMTGRGVLQTRGIDLKPKGLPAEGSGNGIGGCTSPLFNALSPHGALDGYSVTM